MGNARRDFERVERSTDMSVRLKSARSSWRPGPFAGPAADAEAEVVRRVREMVLPPEAGEEARELLRKRLALPSRGLADESRAKIEKRIRNLKQLFEWDEIDEAEYLAKVNAARAELALLPDHDKMRSFDEVAQLVASLPASLDAATPDQAKQLIAMVVEEVTTMDRVVDEIRLRPQGDAVLRLAGPRFGFGAPGRTPGHTRQSG